MNKSAFLVFFVLSLLTGIIVLIVEKMGVELSLFIILTVSLFIGIGAAVLYARRVRMLLKEIVISAKDHLEIYNLLFSSYPGMDDISSVVKLLITKVREHADELSHNIDDIKKIMDAVDMGILVVNKHGNVVYANKYIREFTALGDDITGIYFLDILRSYEAEELFNTVLSGSPAERKEISLLMPEERNFNLRISKIEYCIQDQCYLFTIREITRLKQIEHVRQDFITNASHELKTPLTSIIGYLEALKEEHNKEFINIAYKNANRMQRIVDDMLVLSKADRGIAELNIRNVVLSDVVNDTLTLLNNEISKKHHKFIINIPENANVVYADKEALFHIILNLADNAVKYSDENKEISISSTICSDSEIEIIVKDTGYGIPSNELDRIFERFYTVDKARSRELGGTGLGLSIVRHFVLAHNGRIWAESELGKGSAFHFTIPRGREGS